MENWKANYLVESSLAIFGGSLLSGIFITVSATASIDKNESIGDAIQNALLNINMGTQVVIVLSALILSLVSYFLHQEFLRNLPVDSIEQTPAEALSKPTLKRQTSQAARHFKPSSETASKLMEIIHARRSVFPKDYNGKGVALTQDLILQLLEAARWAPTHKRTEPWRFKVLQGADRIELKSLTLATNKLSLSEAEFKEMESWFTEDWENEWSRCEAMIVIGMNRDRKVPEWEEIAAIGCAMQNLHLMATAVGLAGYWSSWNPIARESKQMLDFLELDENDQCLGVFMLASSDRISSYRGGRQPLQNIVL